MTKKQRRDLDAYADEMNLYTDIAEASHDQIKREGHHPDQRPDPEDSAPLERVWKNPEA